eukprot:1731260-Prymnesium_polylepis.1
MLCRAGARRDDPTVTRLRLETPRRRRPGSIHGEDPGPAVRDRAGHAPGATANTRSTRAPSAHAKSERPRRAPRSASGERAALHRPPPGHRAAYTAPLQRTLRGEVWVKNSGVPTRFTKSRVLISVREVKK